MLSDILVVRSFLYHVIDTSFSFLFFSLSFTFSAPLSFLLLYPPAGSAGGYFGFSSVTPPPRHILVCALTAAFLDRFLSNFVWSVHLGKIYTPIVFGDAAPSVPSFIGPKVIFWWKSCVRSAGHISWWISFKFCTDVHHSQIYTPIVFGDAAPSVPSFIVSKVIFWFTFLCAL